MGWYGSPSFAPHIAETPERRVPSRARIRIQGVTLRIPTLPPGIRTISLRVQAEVGHTMSDIQRVHINLKTDFTDWGLFLRY